MNSPSLWQRQFFPGISLLRLFTWRMIGRYLFCLACLATLLAIFYAEENWRGHRDWENYKRTLEAQGDKIDWPARIPPPVPDDQNFAMAPFFEDTLLRFREFNGERPSYDTNRIKHLEIKLYREDRYCPKHQPIFSSWENVTNTDLAAWQKYYRYRSPTTNYPSIWASRPPDSIFPITEAAQTPAKDVLLALSVYQNPLQLLREASVRPYSRFPLNYQQAFNMPLLELNKVLVSASSLELLCLAQLEDGQTNQAAASLKLIFYLQDSIKSEPFVISYLTRLSMLHKSLNVLHEGISRHAWTVAQLEEFQHDYSSENLLADYVASAKADRDIRCFVIQLIADSRLESIWARDFIKSDDQNMSLEQQFLGEFLRRNFVRFAPRGWFDQNQLTYAKLAQSLIDFNHPDTQRVDAALKDSPIGQTSPPAVNAYNIFLRWMPFQFLKPIEKQVHGQAANDFGALACALERYWLARGSYPEKLDELVPQYISALPREIVADGPLKYHRTENGFYTLYSVGFSGKDLGVRRINDEDTGNWVWTFPSAN